VKAKAYQEDTKGNVVAVRFTDQDGDPFILVEVRKPQADFGASKEFTVSAGKAAEVAEVEQPAIPAEGP